MSIDFFRPHISDQIEGHSSRGWKKWLWLAVFILIVGSFFGQMILGLCPVP